MSDQPEPEARRRSAFDEFAGAIDGLPGVRKTRPSTFTDTTPLLGDVQTYVVQSYSTDEGVYAFLQSIDAAGSIRLVLPPKVTAALVRQRESLARRGRSERGRRRWEAMTESEREASLARLQKKAG